MSEFVDSEASDCVGVRVGRHELTRVLYGLDGHQIPGVLQVAGVSLVLSRKMVDLAIKDATGAQTQTIVGNLNVFSRRLVEVKQAQK